MDSISKKNKMKMDLIKKLRVQFSKYNLDGYIVPKNDEYFSEFSSRDRLNKISNFTGSAGYAVILKKKSYLFVDSRYTIQAKIESGKKFEIIDYQKIINYKFFKNLKIGLDPSLFTSGQIKKIFPNSKIRIIKENLIDKIIKFKDNNTKPFYSLNKKIVGEDYKKKIDKIITYLKKK